MSDSRVRDLHVLRETDIRNARTAVLDIWRAWSKDWLPPKAAGIDIAVDSHPSEGWCQAKTCSGWAQQGSEPFSWLAVQASSTNALACLLIGRDSTVPLSAGDWALSTAQNALDDLWARLLGHQVSDGCEPSLPQPHSGDLYVDVPALGLHMRLSFPAFRAWCARQPAAKPSEIRALSKALNHGRVSLVVQLQGIELAVADLQELNTGDVIRLPTALTEDLMVECLAGTASFSRPAKLGQLDAHLAIQWPVV